MRPKSGSIEESRESKSEVGGGERTRHDHIGARSDSQKEQSEEGRRLTKAQAPKSKQAMLASQASQSANYHRLSAQGAATARQIRIRRRDNRNPAAHLLDKG